MMVGFWLCVWYEWMLHTVSVSVLLWKKKRERRQQSERWSNEMCKLERNKIWINEKRVWIVSFRVEVLCMLQRPQLICHFQHLIHEKSRNPRLIVRNRCSFKSLPLLTRIERCVEERSIQHSLHRRYWKRRETYGTEVH